CTSFSFRKWVFNPGRKKQNRSFAFIVKRFRVWNQCCQFKEVLIQKKSLIRVSFLLFHFKNYFNLYFKQNRAEF
ncbi:hypothetical protein, partial [Chryseobacterium indoltheticum]|uniref:hypothetical protein n=1 Tax=Chryseobacterium indoltheticum TaxID=254 RepID=UPI003F4957AB